MKQLARILLALALMALAASSAPTQEPSRADSSQKAVAPRGQSISCEVCHSSKSSLAKPPYLRPCPRAAMLPQTEPSLEEAPEEIILDALVEKYEPVRFSHRAHAMMVEGCSTCHHHTSIGDTPACENCHGAPFNPENLEVPGLTGALHRQCISCHLENRGVPPSCTECHGKREQQIR